MKKIVYYLSQWQVQAAFLFLQITFSLFGFYNYFFNFNLSQKFLTQQVLDNEKILAESGTKTLGQYFKNVTTTLSLLESNDLVDQQDLDKTRQVFRKFISAQDSSVKDIARYDQNGKLIIIENRERIYTGENDDFSDKDFIQWSKLPINENKIYVSAPYIARAGSTRGKTIFVVATPSYLNHVYQGTIAIRISLDEFKSKFIDPLGGSDEESIITDTKGTVLTGKDSLINYNLADWAQRDKWPDWQSFIRKFKTALSRKEGTDIWTIAYPREDKKEVLVAYKKIDIQFDEPRFVQNDLILFITRNKPTVLSSLTPFFTYGTLWLGGSIIITFSIGVILTILKKKRQT